MKLKNLKTFMLKLTYICNRMNKETHRGQIN